MAARPVYGATRYLGAQKQNNGIDCNFFAIGNRCGFSNRGYGSESAANRPPNGLFPLFDAREGIANREKVAKKLRFLFSRGMDRCNGAGSVKDVRGIDDDNGTNPTEEDRHFANVAIAFFRCIVLYMPICHVVVVMASVFRRREIIVKVAVSACLLGVRCRFDGRSKPSAEVQCFLEGHECQVVKICPEVMGGLSIPHPPHEQRVLDGQVRVVDAEGNDHTEAFEAGARAACSLVCESGCTHAILKAKSPSCGVGEVYDGTFSDVLVPGDGVVAKMLKEAGVVVATEKNFRERFGCE